MLHYLKGPRGAVHTHKTGRGPGRGLSAGTGGQTSAETQAERDSEAPRSPSPPWYHLRGRLTPASDQNPLKLCSPAALPLCQPGNRVGCLMSLILPFRPKAWPSVHLFHWPVRAPSSAHPCCRQGALPWGVEWRQEEQQRPAFLRTDWLGQ